MHQPEGFTIAPSSGAVSPETSRNSVDFPAPLRPTSPTRRPAGRRALALSRIARPAILYVMFSSLSIARLAGFGLGFYKARALANEAEFQMQVERTLSIIKPDDTRR